MGIRSSVTESIALTAHRVSARGARKWNGAPFGSEPRASKAQYLDLFAEAKAKQYPEVNAIEAGTGCAIDRTWLDHLALHTQVTIKTCEASITAYPHWRMLDSLLRKYIANAKSYEVQVVEIGRAWGCLVLPMAKSLADAGVAGHVLTIDMLPHKIPVYWNCMDDLGGRRSRAQLLAPWRGFLQKIVFLQGDTLQLLPALGLERGNFASLDARHISITVPAEFQNVAPYQRHGGTIVFNDVKLKMFVKTVDRTEASSHFYFTRLSISGRRGYAWATRW